MTTIKSNTQVQIDYKILSKVNALAKKIGNTPLIPVEGLHGKPAVKIFAKAEWEQFSGSVKARAAFNIIREAVLAGELNEDKTLLDATSGNTGIAYAAICRELGLNVTLCLPENASTERKKILKSLGAEIIYTSPFGGTDEAQEKAGELAILYSEKYFYASQYTNAANWKAHYDGTAVEIILQAPGITHFVAGLGTTGTFVGTSRRLKEFNPQIEAVSLQPDLAMHGIEGWKHLDTAIVPQIYDPEIADDNRTVSTESAWEVIRHFAKQGLLLSPSSAANIAGAVQVASEISEGHIVTILPDNAEKYAEVIKQIL